MNIYKKCSIASTLNSNFDTRLQHHKLARNSKYPGISVHNAVSKNDWEISLFCHRGQNALHMLAIYNKDNAAAIFEVFRQNRPNLNVNAFDADENTGMIRNLTITLLRSPVLR